MVVQLMLSTWTSEKPLTLFPMGLLEKLKAYGIGGTTRNWIRTFLTGRKQRVVINSSLVGGGEWSSSGICSYLC